MRFYVRERLIDAPAGRGRGAHFDHRHLTQLQRVRLLQDAGLDLAAIRQYGSEIETAFAKRGRSLKDWERGSGYASPEIMNVYRRLSAKHFNAETSTLVRVTVASGIELLVGGEHRLPSPTKLNEAVSLLRTLFMITD